VNIIHITTRAAWSESARLGQYASPSLAAEGFIHCSTADQVLPVAAKFYRGQSGLVLLVVDPIRLTSVLKWEPPADGSTPPGVPEGAAFPHIYGPLNLQAVTQVLDFEPDGDGNFRLPPEITTGAAQA
jgi:uncharacterized protein (DUF952 family)